NPLKGGLYHATKLTTVSPRYAEEIRTREGGAGLDSVIRFRGADLVGILNGIDEESWDPRTDPALPARFGVDDLAGKAVCKRALQRELGLADEPDVPLIGIVSRLSEQKGTDVILAALSRILDLGAQLVILGSGDPAAEGYLLVRSHHGGNRFRAWIGFSEALAHRIEAASDFFLMPSRFEPCGLNQMYSQRYGTLPIVRATGGLDDTVENYDPQTGAGTGFKLWDLSVDSLVATVHWALDTYRRRPNHFAAMRQRAMTKRFGWDIAAARYADVYAWAIESRRGKSAALVSGAAEMVSPSIARAFIAGAPAPVSSPTPSTPPPSSPVPSSPAPTTATPSSPAPSAATPSSPAPTTAPPSSAAPPTSRSSRRRQVR
ncbi:MAG: glycosyltransferase, partial [Myxococcales bacterium]|nr:glycosyltransferase [Myxococcales bacterium]